MQLPRSAGILLHPTSLPSGRLDRDAYRFVDWLAAAGQSWWQMLPLGPPDEFGSPYRSASAFAASPQLLAAGVDFVLEGLYALKKIGRSDERGYHATESPVRRPREDKFRDEERTIPSIPQGKKKYYN